MGRLLHLNRLPRAEAQAILDQVIALDERIFEHRSERDRERYHAGMRDLSSGDKLLVLYEEGSELIGYHLIKFLPVEIDGRTVWVVGSSAGLLPGYTGSNRTILDAIRATVRYKLRHPGRELCFVSFLLSPAAYDLLADLSPATFPSVRRPRPAGIERSLMAVAAERWGMPVVIDEPERLIASPGRTLREPFERRRESEHVRFFEAKNPRHAQGELLGICIPLGYRDLIEGAVRQIRRKYRRRR